MLLLTETWKEDCHGVEIVIKDMSPWGKPLWVLTSQGNQSALGEGVDWLMVMVAVTAVNLWDIDCNMDIDFVIVQSLAIAMIPVITIFQLNMNFAILYPVRLLIVLLRMLTSPLWALSHWPRYLSIPLLRKVSTLLSLNEISYHEYGLAIMLSYSTLDIAIVSST